MPFPPKLTLEQREAIRLAPVELSICALARQYGVTRHAIRRYRVEGYIAKANEKKRELNKYKRFLRSAEPPKKKGRRKKINQDPAMEQIIGAMAEGMGVDAIERKIDDNLSKLTKEKFDIETKINECKKMQEALYRFLNPTPIVISDPALVILGAKEEYMSFRELKIRMQECGYNAPRLAVAVNNRYSVRALKSYMGGMVPVPKPLADFLKGHANIEERTWSQ